MKQFIDFLNNSKQTEENNRLYNKELLDKMYLREISKYINHFDTVSSELETKFDNAMDNVKEQNDIFITEQLAKLPQPFTNIVNVTQFGVVGDGETDNTEQIQKLLDNNTYLYFPKGVYVFSEINLNAKNHIIGDGSKNSILKSTKTDYGIIIPEQAGNCIIEHIGIIGGVSVGSTGISANAQDMNTRISYVDIDGGYGLLVNNNGGVYNTLNVSNGLDGIRVNGTDNVLANCNVSKVKRHGIIVTNSINAVSNCKAFCCGREQYGAGFYISGSFTRLSNCEAQQNFYEGYSFRDCKGVNANGCISDGAFFGHQTGGTRVDTELGTINNSSIFLHNIQSCNLSITCINGSIFDNTPCFVEYLLSAISVDNIRECNISLTYYDRNDCASKVADFSLIKMTLINTLSVNGIEYSNIKDKYKLLQSTDFSFSGLKNDTRDILIDLDNDTDTVYLHLGNVSNNDKISNITAKIKCVCKKNGVTKNLYSSDNVISEFGNVSINVSEYLASLQYDELTSVSLRIILQCNTTEVFTSTVSPIVVKQLKNSTYKEV